MPPNDPISPAQTLEWLRGSVHTRTSAVLSNARTRFADVGPEPAALFDVADRMSQGGKRLRAAFGYLGWLGCGGAEQSEAVVAAGAGLELFQLAALVHDDVIDDSETRRGAPSAHKQFGQGHREAGMLGSERAFGQAGAILLGDMLLVLATEELHESIASLPSASHHSARRLVTDMMGEVTAGQYLDIVAQSEPWSSDGHADVERAHRVVRSKAARYSVDHPMQIGGALAGATADDLALCHRIGLPIGQAFQLRDDLLGVFGDPEQTGKPSGDDLREGKRTVLITTALAQAPDADAQWLRSTLGTSVTHAEVHRVREVLTTCGAVDAVESLIAGYLDAATSAIADAGWDDRAQDLARFLAQAAVTRTA